MTKIFDITNCFILSIHVSLALLVSVCFVSSLSPLSGERPRLLRSSPGCALTLYDEDIGSSPMLVLTTSASSLDDDWDDRASSAVVSGGCQWILYDIAGFEDRSSSSSAISPSVIGQGSYPFSNLPTFGLPDDVLSAVRCLPAEGTPAIVLFEHHLYFGEMQVINFSNPNLELSGFDNRASSFIITGGVWELYSGANYTGSMVTHGQGRYPTPFFLRPIGNDALTSVRLIVFADCGPPPFLLNGAVSYQNTTEGSEGRYQCDDGFTLEGGMTTVCGANGSWDSSPICRPQIADCGSPPVLFNGTVNYHNTTEGSEAYYHCDDGFILEGEMTAVCRADGRWSSTPVCRQTTGGSNNDNESTPGVETTTTIIAIIVPLSCVVSFIVGVLVGVVVTYCAGRRKHAVALSGDLNQPMEQSNTVYEDVTEFQYPENLELNENTAYNVHSNEAREDIKSQNDDGVIYYCN